MAGSKGSFKIGRSKFATSSVVRVTFGKEGDVERIREMRETTVGPTRTGRVLPMMMVTFLGIIEAMVKRREIAGLLVKE
jgi:hypothetical protein